MDVDKIAFILDNVIDDTEATLLATPSPVSTLPVANLKKTNRSYVFRSTSTSEQAIKGNYNGGQAISAFALTRHNLTGTIRLRIFSQQNQAGTTVYDSTALVVTSFPAWDDFVWGTNEWGQQYDDGLPSNYVLFFSEVVGASFQIDIVDASNPDGYFEIARLFMGTIFQPETNMAIGASLEWAETTKQIRTDGGTLYSEPSLPFRRLKFNLDWLSETDRFTLSERIRLIGKRGDFFVAAYPNETNLKYNEYSFAGKFTKLPAFSHNHIINYKSSYVIEEA